MCAKSENAPEKTPKTLHGCIVESPESTRQRVESSQPKNHEDHATLMDTLSSQECGVETNAPKKTKDESCSVVTL